MARKLEEDLATMPRAVAPVEGVTSSPAVSAFRVVVIGGADAGMSFVVDGRARLLVGQSPRCDVRLADREVSRRHAAFDVVNGRLHIQDLSSKNGTFANGIGISEVYLHGGEVLRLGGTTLRIDRAHPNASPGTPDSVDRFGRLLGSSHAMRRLYPMLQSIRDSSLSVLIEGETGTGKELLAEVLHETGPRASGPFVVFDCAGTPRSEIEATLFGVGGVFEQADRGTLLVDEVGDLELEIQGRLAHALERTPVAVRVIATTRRDLERDITAGRFRDDLFYRLAALRVELPPLRNRKGDVRLLAEHFWALHQPASPIGEAILARFEDQSWPGNVRELANAVIRALTLGDMTPPAQVLARESDPPAAIDPIEGVLAQGLPLTQARERLVEEFERRYVERVLAAHGGNVAHAAVASGIARRYFQVLRARYTKG